MSMLSAQIGKLRHESDILRDHGTFIAYGGLTSTDPEMIECADLMCEAADTITELRGALQVASVDYRHLADENAKLQASNEVIAEDHAALCEQNAKLRELLQRALTSHDKMCTNRGTCSGCLFFKAKPFAPACPIVSVTRDARELGVEVEL